jgi:hypothetical protein
MKALVFSFSFLTGTQLFAQNNRDNRKRDNSNREAFSTSVDESFRREHASVTNPQ